MAKFTHLIRESNKKAAQFFINHQFTHLFSLPQTIQIEPTTDCRLNCIMCARRGVKFDIGYMSDTVFKRIMRWGRYAEQIYIAGHGEPLLHPEIFRFMKIIKNYGVKVHLMTSASFLPEHALENIKKYADSCIVSFDALDDDIYKKIRGISNTQIIDFIDLLHHNKVVTDINIVLMRCNMHEVKKIIDRFSFIRNISLYHPVIYTDFMKQESLLNNWNRTEYLKLISEIRCAAEKKGMSVCIPGMDKEKILCTQPFRVLIFNHNGGTHGCCTAIFEEGIHNVYCGNIMKTNIMKIWNCREIVDFRKAYYGHKSYSDMCRHCPMQENQLKNYIRFFPQVKNG